MAFFLAFAHILLWHALTLILPPSTSFILLTAPVLRLGSGLLHLLQEAFRDHLLPSPQTQLGILF